MNYQLPQGKDKSFEGAYRRVVDQAWADYGGPLVIRKPRRRLQQVVMARAFKSKSSNSGSGAKHVKAESKLKTKPVQVVFTMDALTGKVRRRV